MADVDDFLAHYGVKGMRWGVRKSNRELSEKQKKILTASAIAVGSSAVVVGALVAAKYMNRPAPVQNLNMLSIESGKKVVDNLISEAAKRPAFSVSSDGVTKALNPNTAREISRLQERVKNLDLNKSITFLRNEGDVAIREGTARFNGETFTRLMNDPNLSFGEASKRMANITKIMNDSLESFDQRKF
jgi:hypothetical protein